MRKLIAVAYMEARDRAGIAAIGLALGITLALIFSIDAFDLDADMAGGVASSVALVTLVLTSWVLGATMPERDATTRKLAFYLARPLTPLQYWCGRLVGYSSLLWLTTLLVVVPPMLIGTTIAIPQDSALDSLSSARILGIAACMSAMLVVVPHCVLTALHSGTKWLLAGLAACVLIGIGLTTATKRLLEDGATIEALRGLEAFAWVAVVTGLVAGGLLASRGRGVPRAGAAALSLALWSGLGGGAAGLELWSRSIVKVEPSEIVPEYVTPSASGKFVLVSGPIAGRQGSQVSLLIDAVTGGFTEVGRYTARAFKGSEARQTGCIPLGPAVADDDSSMAWSCAAAVVAQVATLTSPPTTRYVELPHGGRTVRTVRYHLPCDGGRRLAMASNVMEPHDDDIGGMEEVLVLDAETGGIDWRTPVPGYEKVVLLAAADGGIVIVARPIDRPALSSLLRVGRSGVEVLATIPAGRRLDVDGKSRRLLVAGDDASFVVLSLSSGAELTRYAAAEDLGPMSPWLLADGRVLLAPSRARHPDGDSSRLLVFSAEGTPLRSVEIPAGAVEINGECAPGRVVARIGTGVFVVSLEGGVMVALPEVKPLGHRGSSRVLRRVPDPSSGVARFFLDGSALVLYDGSMEHRRIVAGR